MSDPSTGIDTRAIHIGQQPELTTGAIVPPIFQTSTFAQPAIGKFRDQYGYSRSENPTRSALENQIAALEQANHCAMFSSGMAAVDSFLRSVLKPGDRVVLGADCYGGTLRLLDTIFQEWQVDTELVDVRNREALEHALSHSGTRLLLAETPSNPLLNIVDITAIAKIAHNAGAILAIDNTLPSPYLQQPLLRGADVVLHSTTKYLGGHSDAMGGAVVTNNDELFERVRFTQFAAGAIAAPLDCWLTSRGIKTLGARMRQHCESAMLLAEWLHGHHAVESVYYPGLPTHPDHGLARVQMREFGGVVSLKLRGSTRDEAVRAARRLAEDTHIFTLADSLGGVESQISYPNEMSHAYLRGTRQEIDERVVRLSVGLEDVADLRADIAQALSPARS